MTEDITEPCKTAHDIHNKNCILILPLSRNTLIVHNFFIVSKQGYRGKMPIRQHQQTDLKLTLRKALNALFITSTRQIT